MRKITPESLPLPVLEAGYSLGSLVRSERKAQGYTQESLALAAEVGRSTIVQIERGSPRVQFAHWLCVLETLGILDGLMRSLPVLQAKAADRLAAPRRSR